MPSFCAMRPVRIVAPLVLQLDFDVDAGGEVELHQRVHRLRRRIDDVEQTLVGADLELLAALLVDMRRPVDGELLDPGRQRNRAAHLRACPLGRIDDLARRLVEHAVVERLQAYADILALHGRRPSACALFSCYSMMEATTPAPTVRPPSRIAKRRPSSIAIGVISSISIVMLSPGITISVPSGSFTVPVTSVVRK